MKEGMKKKQYILYSSIYILIYYLYNIKCGICYKKKEKYGAD